MRSLFDGIGLIECTKKVSVGSRISGESLAPFAQIVELLRSALLCTGRYVACQQYSDHSIECLQLIGYCPSTVMSEDVWISNQPNRPLDSETSLTFIEQPWPSVIPTLRAGCYAKCRRLSTIGNNPTSCCRALPRKRIRSHDLTL